MVKKCEKEGNSVTPTWLTSVDMSVTWEPGEKLKELSANTVAFISYRSSLHRQLMKVIALAESSFIFSPGSLHYAVVYRH